MSLLQDVRIVIRSLGRRPALVAAIILTLALGIGANTAVFSLVDAVVLHPVAATDSKRLVSVYRATQESQYGGSSFELYQSLAQHSKSLTSVSALLGQSLDLTRGDESETIDAAIVSENYFSVLGVTAALGRTIVPRDADGAGVAVLSDALWQRRFGGDSAIVGKQIVLKGQPLTVVGVMRPDFHGTDLTNIPEVWVPLSVLPALRVNLIVMNGQLDRTMPLFSIIGRLAPGMDRERVESELNVLASQIESAVPLTQARGATRRVSVVPVTESAVAVRDRGSLLFFLRVLVGVVVLTLVLACLNIANLLIVRARERAREMGVRIALGAGSRHIIQQLLVESLVLAVSGGIAGIVVAYFSVHALWTFTLPGHISLERVQPGISIRVLLFSCGLSLVTALAFGLLPALRATRTNVIEVIRDHLGSGSLGRRHLGLIALQVAISLVLLVNAGLLVRTIRSGLETEIGFDAKLVAALSMAPKLEGRYAETVRDYDAIVATLEAKPGIMAAAVATHVPLRQFGKRPLGLGPPPAEGANEQTVMVGSSHVSDHYFDVLGLPVLQGRAFAAQDVDGPVRSVILNESAARALFPNESPIGKLVHAPIFRNLMITPYTVVGVVRDTKYGGLQDAQVPFAYFRMAQQESPGAAFTILTRSRQPRAALPVMEQTVGEISRSLKIARAGSSPIPVRRVVADQVLTLLSPQRFGATLLAGFAALALCVSAVGIYGTVAYAVSRRTAEIGIRMALGARASDVLRLVLIDTGIAIGIGAGIGFAGAAVTSTLVRRLLFGVGPFDVIAFTTAIGAIAAMACGAAFVPSWRSVSIDPARAIRTSE